MSWFAASQLNPKGSEMPWTPLLEFKLDEDSAKNFDLFKILRSPNSPIMVLSVTRYVNGEASKDRLTLRFREIRFILDKLRSTKLENYGKTTPKQMRMVTTGLHFTENSQKYFIKLVSSRTCTNVLEFAYSKMGLIERAFGFAWLVMNIRTEFEMDSIALSARATTMALDYKINCLLEDLICTATCCADFDWNNEELTYESLPQCHKDVIHQVVAHKDKVVAFYKFIVKVLGTEDALDMEYNDLHLKDRSAELV